MTVTPEMIAAFADGELGADERRRVEAAIAADPELAAQLERHRRLKGLLAARYAPIAAEPVPDRLLTLIAQSAHAETGSGEVVSMAQARARRSLAPMVRRWLPVAGPALAASLVLAIWQPWQGSQPAGYADSALATVLESRLVAEQPTNADPRILLSFQARDGSVCRAWRSTADGGIACRDGTGWKVTRRFAGSPEADREYRQASSDADILAVAQEMAKDGAMDAQAERSARAASWLNLR